MDDLTERRNTIKATKMVSVLEHILREMQDTLLEDLEKYVYLYRLLYDVEPDLNAFVDGRIPSEKD